MSSLSFLRGSLAAMAMMMAVAGCTRRADRPTEQPVARRETTLDGDKWARRNIALLRRSLDRPDRDEMSSRTATFGFSLAFNPLLMRDPYAADVARLVAAYQNTPARQIKSYDRHLALLRMPEGQRLNHLPLEESSEEEDGRPVPRPPRPPMPMDFADRVLDLPPDLRAAREPELIEQMEAAARERRAWGQLGLAYFRLATHRREGGEAEDAGRFTDRMLQVLREHPVFQDPNRGNTDAVDAVSVAALMLKIGRRDDLGRLIEAHVGDARTELAVGLVAALAGRGDFDAARAAIEKYLRPDAAESAQRLAAALEGKIVLPPPAEGGRGRRALPPADARLRAAQSAVAEGFAARGDVDAAARMLFEVQRDKRSPRAGDDQLAPYEWSRLAMRASENGHPDAALRALEHAIDAMNSLSHDEPDHRRETARLVREAVAIGEYAIADGVLNNSGAGGWARVKIAQAYRQQGKLNRARATLDEALKQAYDEENGGSTMADIAVELQALGEERRAEKVLLDALGRIEGVDFGLGGTGDVVAAAVKMGRVDLLDRLYKEGSPETKLLLCIVASRAAVYGIGEVK